MMLLWWPARVPEPNPETELRKEVEDLQDRVEEFKRHQEGSTDTDEQIASDEDFNGDEKGTDTSGKVIDAQLVEDVPLEVVH